MSFLKQLVKKIFQYEARLVLLKYKPKIIAIMGSVGKTSAREALYLVLSKKFFVRRSQKSFTTELGVPLTILGCARGEGTPFDWLKNIFAGIRLIFWRANYPEWLILEMDGDKPGDLKSALWLLPDILVLTAIGEVPAHIEAFPSIEDFILEKKLFVNNLPRKGLLVYNSDDSACRDIAEHAEVEKISFGLGENAFARGSEFSILYAYSSKLGVPTGMSYSLSISDETYNITTLGSLGIPNEYTALAALTVAKHLGFTSASATASIGQYISLPGRMNLIVGKNDTTIIDDSYNASPEAMTQALSVFKQVESKGKKIAVLGDMLELGRYSAEEHRKIAPKLLGVASFVVCVGLRARRIAEELKDLGFPKAGVICRDTAEAAGEEIEGLLSAGDIVLVKGSQAMRMERIVEKIMRHPEDKKTLLVRQEKEWMTR